MLRSANGWRTPQHYSNRRPPRKPSQPALPPQARRGSAPTPPSRQERPRPERHTPPPPNPARPPRADPRGTPEGQPGGGRPRLHIQGKPPAKIPTTPHPSPRSRATPLCPSLCPPASPTTLHWCVKKRKYKSGLLNTYIPDSPVTTSIEDAFFSGSGLADKKHFTVHVEHRFILFILFICFFFFFFLIFSFISPFSLFCIALLVSADESAQTTRKFIHSVQMALWD